MISACINIVNEAVGAYHRERQTYAVQILNSPDQFVDLFSSTVATDMTVIADATAGGTVQQSNVTDQHIANAIGGQFNSFFRTPA